MFACHSRFSVLATKGCPNATFRRSYADRSDQHSVGFSSLTFVGDRIWLQYWGFSLPVFGRDRT
jgi:hypothetical protein